jgi:hypothetical protein
VFGWKNLHIQYFSGKSQGKQPLERTIGRSADIKMNLWETECGDVNCFTIGFGISGIELMESYPPGGRMSSVSLDAAVGTITLQWMLFFLPSIASVLFRPTNPILAALQPKQTNENPYQQLHKITDITCTCTSISSYFI